MLKRNSNIELLRILSMIMIILGHCNIYGNYDITNMNHFFNKFVIGNTYLGNLGVIIFVLTTGYFMIQKEIRIKKVILFELQVLFYCFFRFPFCFWGQTPDSLFCGIF